MIKIGLLIQDLASDYSKKIVDGTKKYCEEHDIQLFVFIVRSKNWKNGVYDYQHFAAKSLASENNLDGIILVTNTYCQHLPKTEHQKLFNELPDIPMVSFGLEIPNHSSVSGSAENAINELLEHLTTVHGCKNIFIVGPATTSKDIILRFKLFEEFYTKQGRSFEDKIFYSNYTYEDAQRVLAEKKISKDKLPFDGLFCCNDTIAFGCIDYLESHGIRVPEDVKVVGFDNQVRCDFTTPTLTSVNQCIREQLYHATEILHQEILNPENPKQDLYVPSKIVFRNSCGCSYERKDLTKYTWKYKTLIPEIKRYRHFLQDIQIKLDIENVINYYRSFGINSCVCCIYDHPKTMQKNIDFQLPKKAKVFLAFNNEKTFDFGKDFYLNPQKNLYPPEFTFEKGKEVIVNVLFNREYQYGYICYTPGELDYNAYDLVVSTTGSYIATNVVFIAKNEEQHKLAIEKESLESASYYDELTSVLNRRGFFKYANPALKDAVERKLSGGIIFGDMDHLKFINDNFGHEVGDNAIKAVAKILKSVFRAEDLIARLGGDEFIIYSCGLSLDNFESLKNRLDEKLLEYNSNNKNPFELSISLGYAEFNQKNSNLDFLMNQADENQYKEKLRHHALFNEKAEK